MTRICLIFLFMLSVVTGLKAQITYHRTGDPGSAKKQADIYFEKQAYRHAALLYQKVLDTDPGSAELQLRLGDCYGLLGENRKAAFWYERALDVNAVQSKEHWLSYAAVLFKLENYPEAKNWCARYLEIFPGNQKATAMLAWWQDPGKLDLRDAFEVRLFPINLKGPLFGPALTAGGLVFVGYGNTGGIIKKVAAWSETPYYDLYFVKLSEGNPGSPRYFDNKLNSIYHEGPAVFFKQDSEVIFTRSGNTKDHKLSRNLQLMKSMRKPNGDWSDPQPLPFNDKNFSCGHPAIDQVGSTLIFASNRPGGFGGSDLYLSTFENGAWQTPVNLGPLVNTAGNELFPFLGVDGVLYFSSDGSGGLGGLDLFSFDLKNSQRPINLGFPLNSSGDDFGIIWDKTGQSGFLSSNRRGTDKIFSFRRSH